ncbi:MAG TPA: HAD family phosphatase [Cyclobacteriaceae bacterium]|nr:HAD family phosphatase [Cyclobacteriaceae bacterium]
MISHKIKNLIFDLGGVIMDLDFTKTHQAFSRLSGIPAEELKGKIHTLEFFNLYEKGLISDEDFRNELRAFLNCSTSDENLDRAWNAMLVGINKQRLDVLTQLKTNYHTFLLSNTNHIHLRAVNEIVFSSSGERSLDSFFHKAYYSHLMKMRKPDQEIFLSVLKENDLVASETLFMDDIFENVQGAKSVGIQTIQITSTQQMLSLFQ